MNEGISTFYAELLRIRRMIEVSKKQIPMISLIDEIYKGTNAKDRIFAAKETIRNLSKPYAVMLITTHDFELCDLEKDLDIHGKNYHFTEHYKENKILFDYKLKRDAVLPQMRGICCVWREFLNRAKRIIFPKGGYEP